MPFAHINFSNVRMVNSVLGFIINFVGPALLINYFFVFHKDKYKDIINKYKLQKRGRYVLIYSFTSIGLFLGFVLLLYFQVL